MDRSCPEGAFAEAPRRRESEQGVSLPVCGGVWEGLDPSPEKNLLFDLKMEHFYAVYLSWI